MATNKLTQYDFPVPTKEKVARGLAWIAMGAAAVVGVNFAGPHVLTALETVFDIGNMLVRIGILAGCAFAGILIVQALWPALKNLIAVMGYQAINFMRENYPLEQMAIWCDYLERKHQETKDGETVIKGVEKTNKEQAKAIQDRLDEIVTALQGNHDLTPEEVNDLEVETAGLRAEKKVYDDMVEQLSEPLATIRLFVEFQDRGIKQYKILMRVSTAQHTANTSLSAVNGVLRNLFGKNPEKDNAIAARENIVRQLGQTFGELEGMQLQMQSLINAARTQDKIGLANAKKYLTERMRTIESTAVRIPDAVPVSGGQASRLLDRWPTIRDAAMRRPDFPKGTRMSTTNPIPRRNSKRFNLTVSFIAAVLIAGLLVFAKPHYDAYRANHAEAPKAEAPESAPAMRSRPAPQSAETFWQKDDGQPKPASPVTESKPAPDPIATATLPDQPRAKPRDKGREQPASGQAQESSDPYANLKIDKKGN